MSRCTKFERKVQHRRRARETKSRPPSRGERGREREKQNALPSLFGGGRIRHIQFAGQRGTAHVVGSETCVLELSGNARNQATPGREENR